MVLLDYSFNVLGFILPPDVLTVRFSRNVYFPKVKLSKCIIAICDIRSPQNLSHKADKEFVLQFVSQFFFSPLRDKLHETFFRS